MLNSTNSDIYLAPIDKIPSQTINLPGSKSIANRVLLLAALANGTSIIHNIPDVAEDVLIMLKALRQLGVKLTKLDNGINQEFPSYMIEGTNGEFSVKSGEIFCGNSGTTIRPLVAVLSVLQGNYTLTGVERMYERPIKDLVSALKQIGANIDYLQNEGYPPLIIKLFKDNKAPLVSLSGQISSQFLTGLLIALPLLKRQIQVHIYDELISKPYITITLALLAKFGCPIIAKGKDYLINKIDCFTSIEYTIEPDASSASYFLAIGALAGDITINYLSETSLQGDKNFAKVLALMGAKVEYLTSAIRATVADLKAITIDMRDMPDVAMTLAVVALFAKGTTIINGIHSWKIKETDRLQAMYNELTKLGAEVITTENSLTITPPDIIKPNVAIDTYNDHRMAMCFSLVAVRGIPITIKDYQCVGKTFANYFELFNKVCYS